MPLNLTLGLVTAAVNVPLGVSRGRPPRPRHAVFCGSPWGATFFAQCSPTIVTTAGCVGAPCDACNKAPSSTQHQIGHTVADPAGDQERGQRILVDVLDQVFACARAFLVKHIARESRLLACPPR